LSASAIGAIGSASLLTACESSKSPSGGSSSGGSSSDQSGSKKITVMTPFPLNADTFFRSSVEKLGFQLDWKAQTQDNIVSQVLAATQAGNAPDIVLWSSGYVPTLLGAGVPLLALDQYVAQQEKGVFYDQDREVALIDGKQYAVGLTVQPRAIAYRKDIAQAQRATVPDSWTFDEFVDWATKMTKGDTAGFGFEAVQGDVRFPSNFLPLLWSTGAQLVVRDGKSWKIGFQTDQMEKVMSFYDNVVKANATPKDIITWGFAKTDPGLVKNVIASYSTGPFEQYQLVQFPAIRPNVGVAPLPNGGTPTNYWEESVVMIHSKSKNQDNAWKLISQMRSAEMQMAANRQEQNALSVRQDVNAAITDPWLAGFAKVLPQSKVPEQVDSFAVFSQAIGPAMGAMLVRNLSPADATKQLINKMQSVLPQLS